MSRQHAYVTFQEDIQKGKIPGVVLLHGQEQFLVQWAREQLISGYVNEATAALDLSVFDRDGFSWPEVLAACETFPMVSPKKVVVLRDFMSVWKNDPKGPGEEDKKHLIRFLEQVPDSLLLIVTTAETADDRRGSKTALYKALEEAGKVYDFDLLDRANLAKFVRKRFHAAGKEIAPDQLDRLIHESGYLNKDIDYSLYNLESDIQKIVHFSGEGPISDRALDQCISGSLEHGVFRFIDAISGNRKGEAYDILHQLILGGENPMFILSLIIGQLEIMVMGKELREKGYNLQDIRRQTGTNEFRLKKAMAAANQYTVKDLRRILKQALTIEEEVRTGSLSDVMSLELFIAEI